MAVLPDPQYSFGAGGLSPNRLRPFEFAELIVRSIYDTSAKIGPLRAIELAFIIVLVVIAVMRLGKMILYSRVYNELFKGLRGDYGSAFLEAPERAEQKRQQQDVILNATYKYGKIHGQDKAVRKMSQIQRAISQEQVNDQSKISISDGIKQLIEEDNSKVLRNILGIWAAFLFFIRSYGIIGAALGELGSQPVWACIIIILHVVVHWLFFFALLIMLLDTEGTIIATIFNTIANICTAAVFSVFNAAVNKIIKVIFNIAPGVISKNFLFSMLGMLTHFLIFSAGAVGQLVTDQKSPNAAFEWYLWNFVYFMLFNAIYIIVMELDIGLLMRALTIKQDYMDSKFRRFLGVYWFVFIRIFIYAAVVIGAYFILAQPCAPVYK
ncbi:hypothetical protein NEHOM01_1361 [Nematocida homosporus]|uniref:uncharacterized protein n=1 Tax=Nematocida homosporus TaxID=1912981 RepID=UPI0022202F14|nr:uncharacterized protein NEHOM01_1361 [Nematocida homosporus]KAI5186272.1 hypothetical protein NEHOM01_1361 [Nematocida homosporus]